MATPKQMRKLIQIFEKTKTKRMQLILESGSLADIRDCANIAEINRDSHREFLGLEPLTPKPIERIRIINETTIEVNLDAPPNLPFNETEIEFQIGSGWVKVEKRADGLYVNDRKVILYLSERQKNGKILQGYKLRDELSGKPVLHPNILDALYEHQQLIPEDWKKYEKGNIRFIFFWGVIFCSAGGDFCVRGLYFNGDGWYRSYRWLDHDWCDDSPAAMLAS